MIFSQKTNKNQYKLFRHEFHLVDYSQLPIVTSVGIFLLALSFVSYWTGVSSLFVHASNIYFLELSLLQVIFFIFCWFTKVLLESGQGYHTESVSKGLRLGVVLFIISEVMFFFAFFWSFFHVSIAPAVVLGCVWPPASIQELDIWGLPLMNTLLLLSSGITLTLCHRSLLLNVTQLNLKIIISHLKVTVLLGFIFLCCQYFEYKYGVSFSWKENIYGSTFFVLTGFHGFHVTLGTIFLVFCLIRLMSTMPFNFLFSLINKFYYFILNRYSLAGKGRIWKKRFMYIVLKGIIRPLVRTFNKYSFKKNQHLGFEMAAWYWHFVDVVWIFLFITVYWWGS